jgi:uncharacterized protein (DUF433 family)
MTWHNERRSCRWLSYQLSDCVELNLQKLGAVPVLKRSRISVAQILAEIAEGQTAAEVAADFELDASLVLLSARSMANRMSS